MDSKNAAEGFLDLFHRVFMRFHSREESPAERLSFEAIAAGRWSG